MPRKWRIAPRHRRTGQKRYRTRKPYQPAEDEKGRVKWIQKLGGVLGKPSK